MLFAFPSFACSFKNYYDSKSRSVCTNRLLCFIVKSVIYFVKSEQKLTHTHTKIWIFFSLKINWCESFSYEFMFKNIEITLCFSLPSLFLFTLPLSQFSVVFSSLFFVQMHLHSTVLSIWYSLAAWIYTVQCGLNQLVNLAGKMMHLSLM